MITQPQPSSGAFSSVVRLWLELDDETHEVWCVGPDRLVLFEPLPGNSRECMLFVSVDGRVRPCPIRLSESTEPTCEHNYTRR